MPAKPEQFARKPIHNVHKPANPKLTTDQSLGTFSRTTIYGVHGYEYGISQRAYGLGLHARTVSHMPPLGGESQCLCSRSRSSSVQPNSSPRENSGAL